MQNVYELATAFRGVVHEDREDSAKVYFGPYDEPVAEVLLDTISETVFVWRSLGSRDCTWKETKIAMRQCEAFLSVFEDESQFTISVVT